MKLFKTIKASPEICIADDYDFYTIPFALKYLKHTNRDRYLYSELEKLHPCFSDDCCFDARFRFEKSRLMADIVVMQKYKLAEYKNQKKKIYISERKGYAFFEKQTTKNVMLLSCTFFILTCLTCLVFNKNRSVPRNIPKDEKVAQTEPVNTVENYVTGAEIFNYIATLEGKIYGFIWSSDGYVEKLTFNLKGVFPEQIDHFQFQQNSIHADFSSVVFEDNLPVFTASFSVKKIPWEMSEAISNNQYRSELRDLIKQNEIELLEETINPFSLRIVIIQNQQQAYETLLNFLIEKKLSVSEIKIMKSQVDGINKTKNQLKLELLFSKESFSSTENLYMSLLQNSKVFCETESNAMFTETVNNKKIESIKTQSGKSLVKIGKVLKQDGSVIEYYKDDNGKIITNIQGAQYE
ncbi:MAG: hypothetical protein J5710_00215 [Treponema sp.]|nr:hypothetical protein [Treponema sp.]